jgi:tetraacyldisaccharide 4'-kinase
MTMLVAERFQHLGYKVVVISRGYKGRAEKTGGVVSDGRTILMGPEVAGDEPYMMAMRLENVPVIVGHNRFEAGMLAVKEFNPDVLVLDDAFQHLKLERDLDLVLLDYRRPFGNMHLLPRGILREPISALLRGDAFILTRSDAAPDSETATCLAQLKRYLRGKPIFRAFHVPNIKVVAKGSEASIGRKFRRSSTFGNKFLKGRHVFAFSGLANNHDFHGTLAGLDCVVTGTLEFPDHHPYSVMELENIVQSAKGTQADFLVTTEKDYARVAHRIKWPMDLAIIGIDSVFGEDEEAFNGFVKSRIAALTSKDNKAWKNRQ